MAENKGSTGGSPKKITVSSKKPSGTPQKSTSAASKPASRSGQTAKNIKSPDKAQTKKTVAQPEKRKPSAPPPPPPSDKTIHKIMPFLWFLFAVLLLLCLMFRVFGSEFGVVGEWVCIVLGGLFGIGTFLIVALFVYLGIMWRKLVDRHRAGIKVFLFSLNILLFSALWQAFVLSSDSADDIYPGIETLWNDGGSILGGGIVGGSLGWLSFIGLTVIGAAIVLIAVMLILSLLLFDLTPHDIAVYARRRREQRAERIAYEQQQMKEQSKTEAPATKTLPVSDRESNYTRYRREHGVDDDPAPQEAPAQRADDDAPEEIYDDGFFDIKPEEGAVIVDENGNRVAQQDSDEKKVGEEAGDDDGSPFKLNEVFSERQAKQLHANDEDDGAELTDAEAEPEDEEESAAPDAEAEPDKPQWLAPPIDLLIEDKTSKADLSDSIAATKRKLFETLSSFDIRVKDIGYSIGPTITRYEIFPDSGVRVRAIANLVDDIALNLAAGDIRIEAPIPNKPAVGVEVPNSVRATVRLRTLLDTETFRNSSPLTVCLGQDVAGKNIFFDIKKMPHMIIAGTTGSGKSVCINCIVCSLLYKNPPDRVKLIMIDPKKVEFSIYQHIPHLYCPIISDSRKAAGALASAVAEMERRYTLIEDVGVRDIDSYNQATARDPDREYLPKLIIVIDELADLMMMAKADVEQFITRIAQKARAVGIHLIIGTQRPSVDVITGLIKANVPSRIACTVKSQVDSRTILDIAGAEKLIGQGDMLFSPIGLAKPMRVQGAFLEDAEVARVIDFIKVNNAAVEYNSAFMDSMEAAAANVGEKKTGGAALDAADILDDSGDTKFRQAVEIAIGEGKISTSLLQRKLEIGYGRAAKLIDRMEELGYVSEPDGNKPRRILITKQEFMERAMNDDLPE